MDNVNRLAEIIGGSKNVVFFGGAGVSTESNIPDFRSESGLYAAQERYGHAPEEMLSRSSFQRKTDLFFEYYKQNLLHRDAAPNNAHLALAWLEDTGLLSAVITQNIDGLHQAAGSKNVIELHGTNHRHYCVACSNIYDLDYITHDGNCEGNVPKCAKCGSIVRPDVVLYGEQLNENVITRAVSAIAAADCLIIGGTSLVVYPAAGLINYFGGGNLVLINKSKTAYDDRACLAIYDSIGAVLGGVKKILED